MGVRLPAEYQEVEYIQGRICTDPAYIDTLHVPTVNTKLRVKFSSDNNNTSGFFGTRSDPYRFYCATFNSGLQLSCGMTVNDWPSTKLWLSYGRIYDATIENGSSYINGTTITTPVISESQWSDTVGTIQLWSLVGSGSLSPDATAKYYLCQIWENDVLVMNLVPCYRKSDSKPGMYDLVSKSFFTNQGTGEFLIGLDVVDRISPLLMTRRRALLALVESDGNLFNDTVIQGSFDMDAGVGINSDTRIRTRDGIILHEGNYIINNDELFMVVIYIYTAAGSYLKSESFVSWNNSPHQFHVNGDRRVRFAWRWEDQGQIYPSDITGVTLFKQ